MTRAELNEHLADINAGGDDGEKVAYYSRLACEFLHAVYVFIGGKKLDPEILDPWKNVAVVEPIAATKGDPLGDMLRARHKALKDQAGKAKAARKPRRGKHGTDEDRDRGPDAHGERGGGVEGR